MYEPINSSQCQPDDENTNQSTNVENCHVHLVTVFRISIPAGAEINLMGLIEITSPNGISLLIKAPICRR